MMRMRETDGYAIYNITPVELIQFMGDDNEVCDAARVSFWKQAANYSKESNEKLINYLAREDHWSPFAHVSIKFRFRAPLFIARQFQKHVVGFAWNEVSRRYVSNNPRFFIPDTWRKRPDNMKQGSVTEGEAPVDDNLLASYKNKMREHSKDYNELIGSGICPEQARMIMPQAMMTEWIWTGSLMAWARFVQLRRDSHAQAECVPYAEAVWAHAYELFPMSTKALMGDIMETS